MPSLPLNALVRKTMLCRSIICNYYGSPVNSCVDNRKKTVLLQFCWNKNKKELFHSGWDFVSDAMTAPFSLWVHSQTKGHSHKSLSDSTRTKAKTIGLFQTQKHNTGQLPLYNAKWLQQKNVFERQRCFCLLGDCNHFCGCDKGVWSVVRVRS